MSELIPMDKAAKMLGMSPDRLKEMISSNAIFGYRDGASWKFKLQELERFADEHAIDLNVSGAGEGSSELFDAEESDDLILADDSSSASDSRFEFSDNDLILDDDSSLTGASKSKDSSPDIDLGRDDDDAELLFGDSSLDLALSDDDDDVESAAAKKGASANKGDVFDDDIVAGDDSGSTGKLLKAMSEKVGDSKPSLELSEDDLFDDELKLVDSDSLDDAIDLGSDFEDSDIVLEDSDSSSELVLESNDQGIGLSPDDSGISLSDSLELGGSEIDDLELPDDEMVSLSDVADADAATMMQEDDFNLTPFEEEGGEETSGSQVIALDDSDLFAGDSESTMLGGQEFAGQEQVESDAMAPTAVAVPVGVPLGTEFPYTIWQVVSLACTSILLLLGLMIAYDVARNLWMPSGRVASEGLVGFFSDLFGR